MRRTMKAKSPKMVAAGFKAALTRKSREVVRKARNTHQWAVTMTKWLITATNAGVKWQVVEFLGPGGEESRGVVDLIAIRKDHHTFSTSINRGDFLEIVLIQVKGGSAPRPTSRDIERLQEVARRHRAKRIVLAEWHRGAVPSLHCLKRRLEPGFEPKGAWDELEGSKIFGLQSRLKTK